MRVLFLKDWQGPDGSASFKKNEIAEITGDLVWDLAIQGFVKFKKDIDPEIEKAKQVFRLSKKKTHN